MSRRHTRRSCQAAALICLLLLGGCGDDAAKQSDARGDFTDATLASDLLTTQMAALHHVLTGSWQRIGPANEELIQCAGARAASAGMTARQASSAFAYGHVLGVGVTTAVYRNAAAARQAMGALTSQKTQACLARRFLATLRGLGYRTTTERILPASLPGVGSEAHAVEVQAPTFYRGRRYTWRLEAILVRQGRRIDWLGTTAHTDYTQYDRRLAAGLARVTAVAERYLQTGQATSSTAPSG